MLKTEYPRIGETVLNGLRVTVVPKPGYRKRYAFFTTRYGGMDMKFQLDGVWHDTPAGIAHYLEHKMFDMEDGNALQVLSQNGAEPNAVLLRLHRAFRRKPAHPALLRLRALLHAGERGQGTRHHRAGDPHDRGRARLARV